MDAARADILAARHRLATQGWIATKAESFRHLKPPPAEAWLGDSDPAQACELSPLDGAGWTLHPVRTRPSGSVDARWLDAFDSAQRSELFAGLSVPGEGDAAPFVWAHRALCRQGLRLRIGEPAEGREPVTAWLQLRRKPQTAVEAPLLVVDLADGASAVLIEVHERDQAACSHRITQNLRVHLNLGRDATLTHLRLAQPGEHDQWAHFVDVRFGERARYEQVLVAASSGYHLQHTALDLSAARASAQLGSVLFAPNQALDQQVRATHRGASSASALQTLVLAGGKAHAVVDAQARICAGAADTQVRQRLSGIPTGGAPRIVLRPHLEIHHDQVQAAHGATWGALPEEALFYARQRGLDEEQARALIIDGMAHAVVDTTLADPQIAQTSGIDAWIAQALARHLGSIRGGIDG